MNLLVVERQPRAAAFLRELCAGSAHAVIHCAGWNEAVALIRSGNPRIDWVVLGRAPDGGGEERLGELRDLGCGSQVAFLTLSGETAPRREPAAAGGAEKAAARGRLTRLDLFRLLTRPGGAYEDEELILEFVAPCDLKGKRPAGGKV